MSPSFPAKIGHWHITRDRLGVGTYATVLLARHDKIPGLRAAVKAVRRSQSSTSLNADDDFDSNTAALFTRREVAIMRIVAHQRVVKLYDFYEHGDQIYMLLEHAPNNSLRRVLNYNKMLHSRVVVEIFLQLTQGVAYLHSLYIAHRDLKPENILVFGPNVLSLLKDYSYEQRHVDVKLSDFGLSHIVNPTLLSSYFCGTPLVQPPEIFAKVPHRPFPTDIWSVGIILYELLYNTPPFDSIELIRYGKLFLPLAKVPRLAVDAPTPRPETRVQIPFVKHATATNRDGLLTWIFMLDPADRPTALDILAHPYFAAHTGQPVAPDPPQPALALQPSSDNALVTGDHLMDIARIFNDYESFLVDNDDSRLPSEDAVRGLIRSSDQNDLGAVIAQMWMRNLLTYSTDRERREAAWETARVPHKLATWLINLKMDMRTVRSRAAPIPKHNGFAHLRQRIRDIWPFDFPASQAVDPTKAQSKAQKKLANPSQLQATANSVSPPSTDVRYTVLDLIHSRNERRNLEDSFLPSFALIDCEGIHPPYCSQISTVSTRARQIQLNAMVNRAIELRVCMPDLLYGDLDDVLTDERDNRKALTEILDAIEAARWLM